MDQTYPAPTGSREHCEFSMEYDDRATLPDNFLASQFSDGSYSQVPSSELTSPNLDLDTFTWAYHLRDDANSLGGCPGPSSMPSYPLPGPQSDITDTGRAISDMTMPPEMNQSTSYPPAMFGQAPSWMQTDGQFATVASDQYLRDFRTANEDLRTGFVLGGELAVPQFACENRTMAAASEETGTLASTWMTDLETQRTMDNRHRPSTRDTGIQSGPILSAPASRAMTSQLAEVADQQPSQFRFPVAPLEIGAESTLSRAQTLTDELEPSGGPIARDPFANLHDIDLGERHPVSSTVLSTTTSPPVSPTTYLTSPQTESTNGYRARNRVAASRCRHRQKSTITGLKEAERNMMDERDRLLDMKRSLTDQVCCLKEELFLHAKCKEDRLIGEYLELTANRIVDKAREAAEQQRSPMLESSASGSGFDYVGPFEDDG
ncbi:hypothetical protein QBC37DRAFT_376290 [Rhypophila decipiens]|uniref:BZIP domain-containing protein n=1 Tax=Rhypophila decipiens TaxID=261697 RepID=A0AAN7B510_9PEZI|nr:hypothetical protein QBC37DRAFT_376290 [Rhypophila decipiens]